MFQKGVHTSSRVLILLSTTPQMPPYLSTQGTPDTTEPHPAALGWFLLHAVTAKVFEAGKYVLVAAKTPRLASHLLGWVPCPLQVLHVYLGADSLDDVCQANQTAMSDMLPMKVTWGLLDMQIAGLCRGTPTWDAVDKAEGEANENEQMRRRVLGLERKRGRQTCKRTRTSTPTEPPSEGAEAQDPAGEEESEESHPDDPAAAPALDMRGLELHPPGGRSESEMSLFNLARQDTATPYTSQARAGTTPSPTTTPRRLGLARPAAPGGAAAASASSSSPAGAAPKAPRKQAPKGPPLGQRLLDASKK